MEPGDPRGRNSSNGAGERRLIQGAQAIARYVPKPLQNIELKSASRKTFSFSLKFIIVVALIGLMGLGYGNYRLNQGPISLSFAVGPIEKGLTDELQGLSVKIEDAILSKIEETGKIRFLLKNLQMFNRDQKMVALAPFASVGISTRALLFGELAPGSVELINAEMLVHYRRTEGFTFLFPSADRVGTVDTEVSDGTGLSNEILGEPESPAWGKKQLGDLARSISQSLKVVRSGSAQTSYLRKFLLRSTTIAIDYEGERSVWRFPKANIYIRDKDDHTRFISDIEVESQKGPARIRIAIENAFDDSALKIQADLNNVVPSVIRKNLQNIQILGGLDLPISGTVSVATDGGGNITEGTGRLKLAAGHLKLPGAKAAAFLLDEGSINAEYLPATHQIALRPSTFLWGEGKATLEGMIEYAQATGSGLQWNFDLKSRELVLPGQSGAPAVALDKWEFAGAYIPSNGTLRIQKYLVGKGTSALEIAGSVTRKGQEFKTDLKGGVSPMPVQVFLNLVPGFVIPTDWVQYKRLVRHGRIEQGQFHYIDQAQTDAGTGQIRSQRTMDARLDVRDTKLELSNSGLTLEIPETRLLVQQNQFNVDIPEGHIFLPSGRIAKFTEGAFQSLTSPEAEARGSLKFRTSGSAAAMIELLKQQPVSLLDKLDMDLDGLEGVTNGLIELEIPLSETPRLANISLKSQIRLEKLGFANVLGGLQVRGGRVDFNITEKAIRAGGEIRINGVPTQISWQRIFGAGEAQQPPIRFSGTFDDSARDQLGLNLNRFVEGPVDVVLYFDPQETKDRRLRLEANLTDAAIYLDQVPWVKRFGRRAQLSFYVVPGEAGNIYLRHFLLVGRNTADIEFNGFMRLDKDKKMVEYNFVRFAFDGENEVAIQGVKSADNIWNVNARGARFNGQSIFRGLFKSGNKDALIRGKWKRKKINLDLRAEIEPVSGYSDAQMQSVSLSMQKRKGQLTSLDVQGTLPNKAPLAARLVRQQGRGRIILAETSNAGAAFRLIGLYPSAEGGQASVRVFLDGEGDVQRTGTLWARDFYVLGDPVVQEVLSSGGSAPFGDSFESPANSGSGKKQEIRQRILFQQLEIPFSVGYGQFVLHNSIINGPLLGATVRGRVDFEKEQIDVGGTYVPLYGINSAIGVLPFIGQILTGRRGEGFLGITFGIQGKLSQPQVLVNPMSMVAPGIFRQIFEFGQPPQTLDSRN